MVSQQAPAVVVQAVAVEVHPADITQMASCLGVTKAAVSKRVPALVAGGWLERNSDPANARRVVISPTAAAIELVELAAADLERLFADLFTDPRVDPAVTRGAVPLKKLNAHLSALTNILHEKGYGV